MVQMAGVGLMVEVVAHELARASENALQALEGLRGKEVPAEVRARLDTLRAEMKSVSKRLRVLAGCGRISQLDDVITLWPRDGGLNVSCAKL